MVESKQQWKAWLYLSPAIVLLLIFTVWPIINTLRIAFIENYSPTVEAGGYVYGLSDINFNNFKQVIGYKNFLLCLKNTMLLCVLTVPLSTILALTEVDGQGHHFNSGCLLRKQIRSGVHNDFDRHNFSLEFVGFFQAVFADGMEVSGD